MQSDMKQLSINYIRKIAREGNLRSDKGIMLILTLAW